MVSDYVYIFSRRYVHTTNNRKKLNNVKPLFLILVMLMFLEFNSKYRNKSVQGGQSQSFSWAMTEP